MQAEIRIAGELGKPVRFLGPAVLAPHGDTAATLARVAKEAAD